MGLLSRFFGGGVRTINVDEAHQMIQDGAQFVDVRRKAELRSGKAAGVKHIPLHLLHHQTKKLDPSKPVLCICASGTRSKAAARHLMDSGFEDVLSINGGMNAWRRAGLPVHGD